MIQRLLGSPEQFAAQVEVLRHGLLPFGERAGPHPLDHHVPPLGAKFGGRQHREALPLRVGELPQQVQFGEPGADQLGRHLSELQPATVLRRTHEECVDEVGLGPALIVIGGVHRFECARIPFQHHLVEPVVRVHRTHGGYQIGLDGLAAPTALPLKDRGQHTLNSGVRGPPGGIGEGGVSRSRPRRKSALLVHDARLRHHQGLPALVVTKRPGRTPARDRRHDEPRVGLRQRVVGKSDALGRGRPHGVDHHVGATQQSTQALQIGVVVQVQCHAALATQQGGPARELAQLTTGGRLDHDHLGATVGEELRRLSPGQRRRQVDHHEAGQWTVRRRTGFRHVRSYGVLADLIRTCCDARLASIAAAKINVNALVLPKDDEELAGNQISAAGAAAPSHVVRRIAGDKPPSRPGHDADRSRQEGSCRGSPHHSVREMICWRARSALPVA